MKSNIAPHRGFLRKQTGPLMLVHELVPWWLFCYYFMHSLEERFRFVTAPIECASEQNIFLVSMLLVEIRLSYGKLLQEVTYKRGLRPQVKVRCF